VRRREVPLFAVLLLASLASCQDGGLPDHYGTLGVSPTESEDAIKKRYRALAKEHHPDRGGIPERFERIAEAFGVLSDPVQREQYDTLVKYGVTPSGNPQGVPSAMFAEAPTVTPATQESWNTLTQPTTRPILVLFYEDEDVKSRAFANDFLALSAHLAAGAAADTATVNVAWYPDLANSMGVIGLPGFRLFKPGEVEPKIYRGQLTREGLAAFALDAVEGEGENQFAGAEHLTILGSVGELRQFVQHQKASQLSIVLIHDSTATVPRDFLAATNRFNGVVRFASINLHAIPRAHRETYGVEAASVPLPAVRAWAGSRPSTQAFSGTVDEANLNAFISAASEKCNPTPVHTTPRRPGATDVTELDGTSAHDACPKASACEDAEDKLRCAQEEVCFLLLTFSPSFNAMATTHIESLTKVAVAVNSEAATPKLEGALPRFLWVDSMQQPGFTSRLSVEMGHLPKVIAYRPSAEVFSSMSGDFGDANVVEEFVRQAISREPGTAMQWQAAPPGLLHELQ